MSISECFHYPFYNKLIQAYEKSERKLCDQTKLVIPECALKYFKSEELVPFAFVSTHCYVASMKILQQRIKPLEGLIGGERQTLIKLACCSPSFELLNPFSSHVDSIQRLVKFACSAPIRGLSNPPLAALVFERTIVSFPNLLTGTYRDSMRFIGENNYKLFDGLKEDMLEFNEI